MRTEIAYAFPEDTDDNAHYHEFHLNIDAESSVFIVQSTEDDAVMVMLSLPQAKALHQKLGQALVRHERQWGLLPTKTTNIREVRLED